MKKTIILMLLLVMFYVPSGLNVKTAFALDELDGQPNIYVIYDENNDYLFERNNVSVGDEYIDKNMNLYKVILIDEETKTGRAQYIKTYLVPKLKEKKETMVSVASTNIFRGKIGLYNSHNDESYVSGDGYDSVYGKGGIHDITQSLATNLKAKSIDVVYDQTLHLPHDTNAYARSSTTAKRLLSQNNLDGIFDIHRDGTSRGFYITKVNGEERCMVRMVIGKGNANYEENRGFALYLMSVSQLYCPWLFVDIYMGKGHYNQGLKDNMLLFEMGSHLVEKDLVLKTVPELANVISVALFGEFEVSDDNSTAKNTEIPTKSVETPIKNAENGLNANNSINGSDTVGNDIQKTDDMAQNGNDDINEKDNINNENNVGKQGSQTIENDSKEDAIQKPTINGVQKQNVVNANENQSTILSGEKNIIIVLFVLGALTTFIVLASLSNRRK